MAAIHGPEAMLRAQHFQTLRTVMEEAHGEVQTISFPMETPLAEVLDELRSFGLMQQYKLVVVDNADQFVTTHRAALERYAQNPVDHATLVLRSEKWNRGNLDKLIDKVGFVVACQALKPAEAVAWVRQRAQEHYQCTLDGPAATLLVDRLGADLMRLDSELGKLAVMAGRGGQVDRALIEQLVGKHSDEQAWEVQEALLEALSQRKGGALEMVHELIHDARQPEVLVMYFVADLVRKLHNALYLKQQGMAEAALAKEMKLWGPRQALFMGVLRKLSTAQAGRLLDDVLRADRRGKSGWGDTGRNLECFCAVLADHV